MALPQATIAFDPSDYTSVDFDTRRAKVWATNNAEDGVIHDTIANHQYVGSGNGTINPDGTGSITVPAPGPGANPASWQTTIHFDLPDRNAPGGRVRKSFGPFTITASEQLSKLVDEQAVPATYISALTAVLDGYATDAANSAAVAVAAADSAQSIVTADTDGVVASAIETLGTETNAALSTTYARRVVADIRTYGALCDGTTDDSAAVNAAATAVNAAGGGRVMFPIGTTRAANIVIYPNVDYVGQGYGATIVKAPNGYATNANAAVFITKDYATLTGTASPEGPWGWSVRDLFIDANKAGNATHGRGMSIFAVNYTIAGLRVRNARGIGIKSEGGNGGYGGSRGGPEAHWLDVKVFDGEDTGVHFLGPNDSVWTNCEFFDSCRTTHGTEVITGAPAGGSPLIAIGCHSWGSYRTLGWDMVTSTQLVSCVQECIQTGQTGLRMLGNQQMIKGGKVIGGAGNTVGLVIGDVTRHPDGYTIDTQISNCGSLASGGGGLDCTNDTSGLGAQLDVTIFQADGTAVIGTPSTLAASSINVYGGASRPQFTHQLPSSARSRWRGTNSFDQVSLGIPAQPDSALLQAGHGSPEGVVTAYPASTYYQTDGVGSALRWVKATGTGNTGWVRAHNASPTVVYGAAIDNFTPAALGGVSIGASLAATGNTTGSIPLDIPTDWVTYSVVAVGANLGAGTGEVALRWGYGPDLVAGANVTTASSLLTVNLTAGAQNVVQDLTLASGQTVTGKRHFQISRRGDDAADTLANAYGLIRLEARRTS